MEPSVARALSLLSMRTAKIEAAISKIHIARTEDTQGSELPGRYANMFAEVPIANNVIQGSPLLVNLYTNETLRLNAQCVGTWPDDKEVGAAVCLFGGCTFSGGEACEEIRQTIIPELIQRQVSFSLTQTDHGEEEPTEKIMSILRVAPSHLIIDSQGGCNFVNRVVVAYLLGRGAGRVYSIRRPPVEAEGGEIENIYGPDRKYTNAKRLLECERLLLIMSKSSASGAVEAHEYTSFGDDDKKSFLYSILNTMPDALAHHDPQSVASRRQHWNEILDSDEPVETDMGFLLICSYLAGMLSPRARSQYNPVPRDVIGLADEWCGRIKTLILISHAFERDADASPRHGKDRSDAEVRAALSFFCWLLDTEN